MRWLVLVPCALAGCGSSSGESAAGAAVLTSIAIASSAVSRAEGGCWAECTGGTVCNTATGLCERIACDGRCGEGEGCDPVTNTCAPIERSAALEMMRFVVWTHGLPFHMGFARPGDPPPLNPAFGERSP